MFQVGFELAATPTALLDAETRMVRVNRAFRRLFGLESVDLEGHTVAEFTHPDDRARETEAAERFALGQDHVEGRKRYVRRDGSVIHARFSRVVLARDGSVPTLMMCEIVDETELKGALDALQTSEHRLQLALEASNDGIYDVDLIEGTIHLNARAEQLIGYRGDEIPRRLEEWVKLVHPQDLAQAFERLAEHNAGRTASLEAEVRMRHRDGRWVWMLDRGKIFERTPDGQPRRVIGTLTDISGRRAAAEAKALQTELLDTILANVPLMVVFLSPEGRFEYVNRQFRETLGWTLEEMRDRDMLAEFYPDPGVREAVVAFMGSGSREWQDWPIRVRDGRELLTSWTNAILADGRTIGIGLDVTERRLAEAEREVLEAQLLQAQKLESLGLLAGGIAHDFNNLLVGILGNASLAGEMLAPSDPAAPLITDMRNAAKRAAELTRQLLAYAGKGQFVVEDVDVSAIAAEMTTLLRAVISKDAVLRCECAAGLPAVEGDATQLRQVLMNLVTNASEALEGAAGVITMRTRLEAPDAEFRRTAIGGPELGPGPHVILEVEDPGHGMDEATIGRIFDPFFSTKFTGRGLGLAATLGIVRSHRGAIRVRSRPGEGTTVRIVFPAMDREPASGVSRASGGARSWSARGDVLVADDEPMVRRVAAMGLARLGFAVTEAVDGQDALERFEADPARWRLVVLDVTMPRLSGEAALRAIRTRRPDVPAVLYSGYSAEALEAALVAQPGVAFLQKPFTVSALGDAVRSALGETA